MSGVVNQLNWRNDTRFVQLSGILPVESGVPFQDGVIDFSTVTRVSGKVRAGCEVLTSICVNQRQDIMYSRRGVTRGFTSTEISSYDKWIENGTRLYGPFERWCHSTSFDISY